VEPLLGRLARPFRGAEVDEQEVRVGAARDEREPALEEGVGERVGVAADLRLVLAEGVGHRDPEARRLRGDRVLERPALHSGHHGRVECLRVLLAAEDEAGARAGERLVRGRGDEIAVLDRVRLDACGDEPGEVRHVADQERPYLVGDRPEAVGLDRARVGGAAAHEHFRPRLLRFLEHLVVVHGHRLARDLVMRDVVQAAREVDLVAVREVAALGKRERHQRVPRLHHGRVDRHVRLRTRVRLDVRVLGAEQFLRAVDRELLDLVDDLAPTVVPAAGIALGVLVRRHRADGLEHGRPREVLGGDQLDLPPLALELVADEPGDLGIDGVEPRLLQLLERRLDRGHDLDATRGWGRRPDAGCGAGRP
jgi:hypothetical protein